MKRSAALVVVDSEPDANEQRPRTRADCELPRGARPCPWVSCPKHRFAPDPVGLDSSRIDNLNLAHAADADLEAIADQVVNSTSTCSLDAIERRPDGLTLEQVANYFGVTRERIRQIESKALRKLPRAVRRALRVEPSDVRGVHREQKEDRRG